MKTALVTGANRGIGREIALGLSRLGMRIVLGVRDPDSAAEVLAAIEHEGGTASVQTMDLGDARSVAHAVDQMAEQGLVIDVLINNAAILVGDRLLTMDEDDILASYATNVIGPLRLIRALAPGMADRGYGRIVNVSSGWGLLSDLGPGAYGVTKAALNALTVKLAGELPSTVKVNAMSPGWVHTQMGGASAPLTPEEGADTVLFLATLPDNGPTGGMFRNRQQTGW